MINELVSAFYTCGDSLNRRIQFGGWEENGAEIKTGEQVRKIKTRGIDSWDVYLQ